MDFDNPIDINDDEVSINDDIDDQQQQYYDDEDNDITERATVPAALAAAAARRRQMEEDNEFGAGDEERDYQKGGDSDVDNNEEDDEDQNINPDYEQLKGLWMSELACPELLPADAETIAQNVEDLAQKEEVIDELLQRSKSQRQSRDAASGEVASLVAQITKMDLDRTRFMLVDLARTRMAKIENHALHNRTLIDRMTEEESTYLRQYGELLEKHYRRTILDHLPKEAWKKLDEPEMIDSPDLEQFVFCHVIETVSIDVSGEPSALNEDLANDEDDYGDNIQEHAAGSYLIVMYKQIRDLVLEGKVELLM